MDTEGHFITRKDRNLLKLPLIYGITLLAAASSSMAQLPARQPENSLASISGPREGVA